MTIPGYIVINLLVGASVAFSARIQIRTLQRPIFHNRYFSALMLLEAMILLPAGIYFCGFYPDWSWMYLVETQAATPGVSVMAVAAYPIAATMGYLVGYFSARGNSDWVTVMFVLFGVAGIVGLFLVASDKLLWLGSFEQYHRAVGLQSLVSSSLLPSAVLTWLGTLTAWGYLVFCFAREGRLSLRALT
ncbi:MAG: hypothetical protein JRF63_01295 [Deltaproteobacteria bacterium]|nr:hypothetical protein [Deltaproteobacteria bacterium]